jgi:cytidylate kinase
MSDEAPVIAIDGPSASGKGTVAEKVAKALGFRYLDSGALYRLVTLAAINARADLGDEPVLARIARDMEIDFRDGKTWLGGHDVTADLRSESVSAAASRVAAPCAGRCWAARGDFAPLRASLRTGATWAPWCSLMPL